MDLSELLGKYAPLLKQYSLPLILASLGLISLGYGLITFSKPKNDTGDILVNAASDQGPAVKRSISQIQEKQIAVDIEGAVLKPGVYKLASDARVQDALIAAGGLSDKADRLTVAKNLNLAGKLVDGAKLYLPFTGEQVISSAGQNTGQSVLGDSTGSVNINQATGDQLDALPGIGATTAQKIISGRPYQSIDELLQKKIVGKKVYDQIKERIIAN